LSPGFQKDLSSGGNGNNNFPALQEQDGRMDVRTGWVGYSGGRTPVVAAI